MVHICVIGAGTAGLCAAKTANQNGCQVTVFEQAKQVGGTWVYTDHVGKDEYGLDVHTSMYQGLQYVEQNTKTHSNLNRSTAKHIECQKHWKQNDENRNV